MFEVSPFGMIVVDELGSIAHVNTAAATLFGFARAELVGLSLETLLPDRLRARHPMHGRTFLRESRRPAMAARHELVGRRKDGSEIPVEVSLTPIVTADGPCVLASLVDVTARRHAEAEARDLRHELTAAARFASMGQLTAAIVHELRQPLTSMLLDARTGLHLISTGDPNRDALREILEDIVTADQRADQVIRRLRALFLHGDPERRAIDLNRLVSDVLSVVVYDATLRNVSIALDLEPSLPPVAGDRVQLQQLLLNVAVNACHAMADIGDRARTITVRTRRIDKRRVRVDMADTGPGITPQLLDSLFEPFVTTKPNGMGMGLSLSRWIARAHGGDLWAENASRGGAVFHLILPSGHGRGGIGRLARAPRSQDAHALG
jgi:two-component system, LuxR family, sensor kinase FixL